ncbi:MAG: hypothetical protein E7434_03180 [Ruminococcaceae bacterium]|nr:hypothetical protein [Oscillospiraceae bacterium]
MELPLSFQGKQFFYAALLGVLYGVHYDLLRGLRRNGKWLTHLLDTYYALTCLLGNFLLALYIGRGQFRIFMLAAIVLGMSVWFLTCSRIFRRIFEKFWRIFLLPLRLLWQLCKKILKKTKKILKYIFSFVKKRVIIKRKKLPTEERYHAPVQIITHYEVHNIGGDGLCDHDDRHLAAEGRSAARGEDRT